MVVVFIDSVDGDAGLGFLGKEDGGVDVDSVHALSAELRQQGRVNVQDPVGKGLNEGGGDFPEKPGQDESVDLSGLEFGEVGISVLEAFPIQQNRRNIMIFSYLIHPCLISVAGDQGDLDLGMALKIGQDGGCVGASAGGEDGQADHGFLRSPNLPASLDM